MHARISHAQHKCICLSDVYRLRPRIVFILKKSMFIDVFHSPESTSACAAWYRRCARFTSALLCRYHTATTHHRVRF